MSEDELVQSRANEGMSVRESFWPKFKDLTCPWGNFANNS
jgi:hypothetical protein